VALERRLVIEALEYTAGDMRAAARLLCVPERTLWHRVQGVLGIRVDDYRHA
jgi:DNA-binding NtrC family response regulator